MATVRELTTQVRRMQAHRANRPHDDEEIARRETVRRRLAQIRANLLAEPELLPEPDLFIEQHRQWVIE